MAYCSYPSCRNWTDNELYCKRHVGAIGAKPLCPSCVELKAQLEELKQAVELHQIASSEKTIQIKQRDERIQRLEGKEYWIHILDTGINVFADDLAEGLCFAICKHKDGTDEQ